MTEANETIAEETKPSAQGDGDPGTEAPAEPAAEDKATE